MSLINILNEFGTTTTVTSTATSTVTATITNNGTASTITSVVTSTSTIQTGNSWLLPLTFIIVLLAVAVILSFVRRKKPVVPVES